MHAITLILQLVHLQHALSKYKTNYKLSFSWIYFFTYETNEVGELFVSSEVMDRFYSVFFSSSIFSCKYVFACATIYCLKRLFYILYNQIFLNVCEIYLGFVFNYLKRF